MRRDSREILEIFGVLGEFWGRGLSALMSLGCNNIFRQDTFSRYVDRGLNALRSESLTLWGAMCR